MQSPNRIKDGKKIDAETWQAVRPYFIAAAIVITAIVTGLLAL